MDAFILDPMRMSHNEFQVIAAAGHIEIDEHVLLQGYLKLFPGLTDDFFMHCRMSDITADIGFYDTEGNLSIHFWLPFTIKTSLRWENSCRTLSFRFLRLRVYSLRFAFSITGLLADGFQDD
jgi:hypothetical protein